MESQFQQTQVIADFEEAPAAALRNVYGDQLIVSGCWLHYAQALIKRLRKLGLTDAYRNDEETQTIFLLSACCRFHYYQSVTLHQGFTVSRTEELIGISVGQLGYYDTTVEIRGETVDQQVYRRPFQIVCSR